MDGRRKGLRDHPGKRFSRVVGSGNFQGPEIRSPLCAAFARGHPGPAHRFVPRRQGAKDHRLDGCEQYRRAGSIRSESACGNGRSTISTSNQARSGCRKTDAKPGEPKGPPPIPWWAIFWPYRVQLEDVKCDDADVLFKLQEKESGIYHTFLEITPNGHDFEYDGKGRPLQNADDAAAESPACPPAHPQASALLLNFCAGHRCRSSGAANPAHRRRGSAGRPVDSCRGGN